MTDDKIHAEIGGIRADLVAGFDGIGRQLTSLVARVDVGFERTDFVAAAIRADLGAMAERTSNALSAIRDDITVNMTRVDRTADRMAGLRSEHQALASEVALLTRKLARLDTAIRELRGEP